MIKVERGSILIYRVFDIAEEVNLSRVEKLLSERASQNRVPDRLRLTRPQRHAIVMRNAPITVHLGELEIRLGAEVHRAEAQAKVWDYGVMSLMFQVNIPPGTTSEQLLQLASSVETEKSLDELARERSRELSRLFSPALKGQHEWEVYEDYSIFFIEKFSEGENALDIAQKVDIPALILAEPRERLSIRSRQLVEESFYQYADRDLTVIDWNSAFVVEPSGSRDVPDVLEFALTQLMELRYYDDLLDQRLSYLYDQIEAYQGKSGMAGSQFKKLSHEASVRFIEFSEFMERVDNSLKLVGDFYLATIFRGAVKRFRLTDWQQSTTRKMNLLAQLSALIQGEVNTQRSHWMEITVIALIAFEVISTLLKL